MKANLLPYLIAAVLGSFATIAYCKLSPPSFWDQRLDVEAFDPLTKKPTPVYWTRRKDTIRFHTTADDKCFFVKDKDDSFAGTDPKDMHYLELLVFCPSKGAGWVNTRQYANE